MQPNQDERTTSSSKDESQADVVAPNTEELRNSVTTPDSINTSGDCAGQDVEENVFGSDRIKRSLNPSPWKEIWSVLQDKSLANCPLSTKSVEFGREIFNQDESLHQAKKRKAPKDTAALQHKENCFDNPWESKYSFI